MVIDFAKAADFQRLFFYICGVAFGDIGHFATALANNMVVMVVGPQFVMSVTVLEIYLLNNALFFQRFDNTV